MVVFNNAVYLAVAGVNGNINGTEVSLAPVPDNSSVPGAWTHSISIGSGVESAYAAIASIPLVNAAQTIESDALAVAVVDGNQDIEVGVTYDGGAWTLQTVASGSIGDTEPYTAKLASDVLYGHVALAYSDFLTPSAFSPPYQSQVAVRGMQLDAGTWSGRVTLPTDGGLDDVVNLAYDQDYNFTSILSEPLYAAWVHDPTGIGNVYSLVASRSNDHGATWSTPITIDNDASDLFPSLVVINGGATLLVAYGQIGATGYSNIEVARIATASMTVTGYSRVNDDPSGCSHHWSPAFDPTDPDGTIGVVWYDGRAGGAYDVWYSGSTDLGVTWSANERATQASFADGALTSVPSLVNFGADESFLFWAVNGGAVVTNTVP